jgi:Tfp pilus assembly PilM family ATPase
VAGRDFILGISISGGGIQAVELERDGTVTTLRAIDEWENSFSPANENGTRNDGDGRQLGEQIARFIKKYRVLARRVSLALDTSFLFINTIPTDQGMTRNEISDQVKWELAQYYPDVPSTEFITDLHVLTERSFGPYNEAMSVSLWRRDALSARKAVAAAGLELHIVDADHFAAETAYRVNYPDSYRKLVALVGVKETRIDITMMRNGGLDTYQYAVVGSNAAITERIAALSQWNPDLHSIMVYGPYLDRDLLTSIRNASPILVEGLNPFRHVQVAESMLVDDHMSVPSYRFGAAVGVALRRD